MGAASATVGLCPSTVFFAPAWTISPSRVMQAPAMISSSKSRFSAPSSSTSSSSSEETLRAYSDEECSAIEAGRFSGDTIVTSCLTTVSPGSVSSQLPPVSPARSTMTLPAFIFFTLSAVTRRGAGRPGHERRRDDDVERRDLVGELLLLGLLLLVGQLARVATLALGALAGLELEELRAERLDLLGATARTS